VNRFFRVYTRWPWRTKPVMLTETCEPKDVADSFKVWNPKTNSADRAHVMPVITPAYPAMNSTHNVTETTMRILLEEFSRGHEMVRWIEEGCKRWSDMYAPFPYFERSRHFLHLEILARTDEVYQKFSGWVESKLRILTKSLEALEAKGLVIRPIPEQYDLRGSDPEWPCGCGMFIALTFLKGAAVKGQEVDLRPALSQFVDVVSQWCEQERYPGEFLLRLKRICKSELPGYALEAEAAKHRGRLVNGHSNDGPASD